VPPDRGDVQVSGWMQHLRLAPPVSTTSLTMRGQHSRLVFTAAHQGRTDQALAAITAQTAQGGFVGFDCPQHGKWKTPPPLPASRGVETNPAAAE